LICNSFNCKSAITLTGHSPSSAESIFSLTAESPADVDYWSHEWGVGMKSGVKIPFVLEKLLLRENLKQDPVLNKLRGFILPIIEVLLSVSNLNKDESITRR
jgi:hypothetical protein